MSLIFWCIFYPHLTLKYIFCYWLLETYIIIIINLKVTLLVFQSACLSITLSERGRGTDFDEVWHSDTLIFRKRHRLLFTTIIDIHAVRAVGKT